MSDLVDVLFGNSALTQGVHSLVTQLLALFFDFFEHGAYKADTPFLLISLFCGV
jgi:hypothetical protein